MLRILLSSVMIIILLSLHSHNVLAKQEPLDKCRELLNEKVQEDILTSFPEIKGLMETGKGFHYEYFDLIKINVSIGKEDSHLNSLIELFSGTSIGQRHLLIIGGNYDEKWNNSSTGYLFYKETNGTNVLLKLKRGKFKWVVVEQSKKRGKYITLAQFIKDCERNY